MASARDRWAGAGVLAVLAVAAGIAGAETQESRPAKVPDRLEHAAYAPKGADTCLKCHDEDSSFPVMSVFRTRHATRADSRTPFAGLQCESCHGPGAEHAGKVRPGEPRPPIGTFGRRAGTDTAVQNGRCLACHQDAARGHWTGSAHESADVPCAACHTIHAAADPVLATASEPQVCFGCHTRERGEMQMPSTHPVRHGRMACSDCHAVHGTINDAMLARGSVNDTCFTCHAEKRGPLLWEHAPVVEDCAQCHRPHGSVHPAMLAQRPPMLCQQCHSQAGHPAVPYTADGLPSRMPSAFLLAGSCTSCHSRVHGSNHPSGAKLLR